MERAGITYKNVTRAAQTLEKALNRLIEEGTLASFTPIPHTAAHTFTVVFSHDVAARIAE